MNATANPQSYPHSRRNWSTWTVERFLSTFTCWDVIPGVYVLQNTRGRTVYVGHGGNVRSRIISHRRRFNFSHIKVAVIRDDFDRKWLERKLLYRLRPEVNQSLPPTLYGSPAGVHAFGQRRCGR